MQNGLAGRISLRTTGCHGFCEMGPFILTEPQKAFYTQVKPEHVPRIIEAVLARRATSRTCSIGTRRPGTVCHRRDDIPFFKHQQRHDPGHEPEDRSDPHL